MLTEQFVGQPGRALGKRTNPLSSKQQEIITALDFLFTEFQRTAYGLLWEVSSANLRASKAHIDDGTTVQKANNSARKHMIDR